MTWIPPLYYALPLLFFLGYWLLLWIVCFMIIVFKVLGLLLC